MLNELEKDKLQPLLHDELLLSIIKKVFEKTIDANKPLLTKTDDDNLIGQKYRAYETAREILTEGFKSLISNKVDEVSRETFDKSK